MTLTGVDGSAVDVDPVRVRTVEDFDEAEGGGSAVTMISGEQHRVQESTDTILQRMIAEAKKQGMTVLTHGGDVSLN